MEAYRIACLDSRLFNFADVVSIGGQPILNVFALMVNFQAHQIS